MSAAPVLERPDTDLGAASEVPDADEPAVLTRGPRCGAALPDLSRDGWKASGAPPPGSIRETACAGTHGPAGAVATETAASMQERGA